jgi:hypothetical protein
MSDELRTTALDRTGRALDRQLSDRSNLRIAERTAEYEKQTNRSAIRYIASRSKDAEQLAEMLDILGLDATDGK